MGKFDHIDPGNSGGSVLIPELPKYLAPGPVVYNCAECSKQFEDIEALRTHKLQEHRIVRPYLYLGDQGHHQRHYVIARAIQPGDVHFLNAEEIYIGDEPVEDPAVAAKLLSGRTEGRTEVRLETRGYAVNYRIEYQIISDSVAEQVEKTFLESNSPASNLAEGRRRFNDKISELDRSALHYVAALDRYLLGIMAKDRLEGCQIRYEDYSNTLGESLDKLGPVGRPFSEAVIAVIHLILNKFDVLPNEGIIPSLAATRRTMREGVFTNLEGSQNHGEGIPVDSLTELIMRFATGGDDFRRARVEDFENMTGARSLSESDRLKLHLLLLAYYADVGNSGKASEHYARLRHAPQVADYADTIYENVAR